VDPEKLALEEESEMFKKIIARQTLEIEVKSELVDRFDFKSYYEANLTSRNHLHWYNNERKHGLSGRIKPHQKWNQHQTNLFASSGEAESGNAGEQPVRISLMNGNDMEQVLNLKSAPSFN
jgi:hypothetical protein